MECLINKEIREWHDIDLNKKQSLINRTMSGLHGHIDPSEEFNVSSSWQIAKNKSVSA